jgi:hypothetical protein
MMVNRSRDAWVQVGLLQELTGSVEERQGQ